MPLSSASVAKVWRKSWKRTCLHPACSRMSCNLRRTTPGVMGQSSLTGDGNIQRESMEAAPQLKASGLEGDYRILADFNGTVLAGSHSKYGVQFVTWDWDYGRTRVAHGHYFMENYDGAKQDFATRSGLIQKEQLFSPEQMTEIYRCCADSVAGEFFELTDKQEEVIRSIQQQIEVCVPDLNERIRQQEEALEHASQEQTMYVNVAIQSGLKSIIKDKLEKIFLSENKAISY